MKVILKTIFGHLIIKFYFFQKYICEKVGNKWKMYLLILQKKKIVFLKSSHHIENNKLKVNDF